MFWLGVLGMAVMFAIPVFYALYCELKHQEIVNEERAKFHALLDRWEREQHDLEKEMGYRDDI